MGIVVQDSSRETAPLVQGDSKSDQESQKSSITVVLHLKRHKVPFKLSHGKLRLIKIDVY